MKTKNTNHLFKISFVCIYLLLCSSCAIYKGNDTKTIKINGSGIIQKPVVVDLMVDDKKVTGHSTRSSNQNFDDAKNEAVSDALKSVNGDVLVEPTFSFETKNGKTEVTVNGWSAKYINFRSIKTDDLPLLQAGTSQDAKIYKPVNMVKKKGLSAGGIVAIIIVTGLLIGLAAGGWQ